jgi:hypothetical protein
LAADSSEKTPAALKEQAIKKKVIRKIVRIKKRKEEKTVTARRGQFNKT